jgi:hypothetical protein
MFDVITIFYISLSISPNINLLKARCNLLHVRNCPYRAVNTFHCDYKNQSFNEVKSKGRCLF